MSGTLGLPPGFQKSSPFPFAGVNQQDARLAIGDQEFYWLENLLRVGNGWLQALPDIGTALYTTTTKTIVSFFFFNIGPVNYAAIFFTDGTAVQVRQSNGAVTVISNTANTFYQAGTGQLPACCGSGGQYLLIANNNTSNDYWIWDGAVLYGAGTLAPFVIADITSGGSGYTSAPTVTAFGGSGSGVTATASIANGSVVFINITNPGTGYLPGEIVQFAFSGGGSDNSAVLQANITASSVGSVLLLSGGSGYTTVPTVGFSSGAAAATAVLTPTAVASVTVSAGGAGYTGASGITLTGGGGSGATATLNITAGAIVSVTITDQGSGYTSPPTPVLTGPGAGATLATVLVPTSVAAIDLTSGGSGYTTTPTVSITGGGGSGATAQAVLSAGSVTSVTVVNGGSGFIATPPLTFVGGGGSGAAATANITAGAISSVTVTAGGTGYTSAPAVVVGVGSNNAASAMAQLMPFGISGTSIETFGSRVWIAVPHQTAAQQQNGGVFNVSAPGSLIDFATSDGGLIYTSTDRFLRSRYIFFRQSNGYLYPVGDSSASVISNVQTAGVPATTTFNYQNADPQTGAIWRDTVADFGRTIVFANQLGVFGLYGGSVTKVSAKLDRLFQNAVFPGNAGAIPCVTPSASVVTVFNVKLYCLLLTIRDPFTGAPRTVQLLWDERNWYIASSNADLSYIGMSEMDSNLQSYGTDGTHLYPMFTTPSSSLTKVLAMKYYGADRPEILMLAQRFYVYGEDKSTGQLGVPLFISTDYAGALTNESTTTGLPQPQGSNYVPNCIGPGNALQPIVLGGTNQGLALLAGETGDTVAPLIGLKLVTQAPDFAIYHAALGWLPQTGIY